MRNNNKSPKSGNDRAFGKGKFGDKGRTASRASEHGSKDYRNDSGERSSKSYGKTDYIKSERPSNDRSSNSRWEKQPYRKSNNDDNRFDNSGNKRPYRPTGDREDKKPFRSEFKDNNRSRDFGKPNDRRSFQKDRKTEGFVTSNKDRKKPFEKGKFDEEQEFRPAYEPKFKRKDFGDKNKRDFFERKNKWEDKADKEGKTFENKRPEGKFTKPVINKRQHNPSGKSGSPRYTFDKDGAKPSKGTQSLKSVESKEDYTVRLNRYISNSGICSRREADDLISSGQITVNGKVMTEMGYQVKKSDTVKYGKKVLNPEKLIYVLMNKPKDYITTMDDPENRKTVMDLLEGAFPERVYPVGRLDRNTTGLLLLTNDGEMADKLTHPSYNTRKIYQAELDKPFTVESFEKLKEGVELEDGFIKPDELAIITPDAYVVGIEIHSGKNRVVRRIFESLGYDVKKLDRTVFANLNKKDLPRGKWRYLSEKEVIGLKFLS